MRDHESTHNPPISTSDSQQSLFPSEGVSFKSVPNKDGMLILNFFDAIRESGGKHIFRCWKFQLPHLGSDAASTKYALEALDVSSLWDAFS